MITETEFGEALHRVLSPSETIQSAEFLRGRTQQLDDIRRAFHAPGRQIFIHGPRGVGKSSLAQTAAYQRQSSDAEPIAVLCTAGNTCFEIVKQVVEIAIPNDPRLIKKTLATNATVDFGGISFGIREEIEQGRVPTPQSLSDCSALLSVVAALHSKMPVVIIDEFDQIADAGEQLMFANLMKMIGDTHLNIDIIFCGIGESIDDLFNSHPSAHRYFHAVPLERLQIDPRLEIIDFAADKLGIAVDDTTRFRIATVSDGFPHFVHLICEHLFWAVFLEENGMRVTANLFEDALTRAVGAIAPELKKPYEKATQKYTNDCEQILWAVADSDVLVRPSREIWESYTRIMGDLKKVSLKRETFNNRMNALKRASHGEILTGTRAGWYEYTEKMLRGYARLRAMQHAVKLEREHPLQPRRFGGLANQPPYNAN